MREVPLESGLPQALLIVFDLFFRSRSIGCSLVTGSIRNLTLKTIRDLGAPTHITLISSSVRLSLNLNLLDLLLFFII